MKTRIDISHHTQEASGRKTYRKSRVRNVHTQEDCLTDQVQVSKVSPPKASHESPLETNFLSDQLPNEPDGNEVVAHELVVVFPWFFETENENEELLGPVGCLHEIIQLELWLELPVRIT